MLSVLLSVVALASGSTGPLHWPGSGAGLDFTGPWVRYTTADTFYLGPGGWSPFMDGTCGANNAIGALGPYAELGLAQVRGRDPRRLRLRCSKRRVEHPGWQARYASAAFESRGLVFQGSYVLDHAPPAGAPECSNWCTLGPFAGWDWSSDRGRTWHEGHVELPRVSALHVVDSGRTPSRWVYLVGHGGAWANWLEGDDVYLLRAPPTPAGLDNAARYQAWTGSSWGRLAAMRPLLHDPGHLGSATLSYDRFLRTWLLVVGTPTFGADTSSSLDTVIYTARRMTGPYRLAHRLRAFGPQAYFASIPTRFMHGHRAWLSYSANWVPGGLVADPAGSAYGWVLREIRLAGSDP